MTEFLVGGLIVGLIGLYVRERGLRLKAEANDLLRQQQATEALTSLSNEHKARITAVLSTPSFQLMRECLSPSIAEEVDESIRLVLMGAMTPEQFTRKLDLIVKPFIMTKPKHEVLQPGETIEDLYNQM